jgi:hypothetical protein
MTNRTLGGAAGMTLLEYIGASHGSQPWYGVVTNTCYMFGLSRSQGYVDNRDVPGLLDVMEAGKPIFRVVRVVETNDAVVETASEEPTSKKSKRGKDAAAHASA